MSKRGCGSPEHLIHRRLFLEGTMAGASASAASFSGLFSIPAFCEKYPTGRQEVYSFVVVWGGKSI